MLRRRLYMLTMGALLANAAVAQFWTSEKPAYLAAQTANCPDCQLASQEANSIAFPDQDKDSFQKLQDIIGKDLSKELNGFSRPDAAATFPQTVQSMIPTKADAPEPVIPVGGFQPIFMADPSFKAPVYPTLSTGVVSQLQKYYKNELPFAQPGSLPSYFGNNYGPATWNNNTYFSSFRPAGFFRR